MVFLLLLQVAIAASPAPKTKTAIVRGKVTVAETGSPLKLAQVVLRPANRLLESLVAATDAQGTFELKNIEPGSYTANCSKGGYVSMGWQATNPDQPSERLVLGEDQVVKDVDFALPRGAVMAGTITDEDGGPVPNVAVQALVKTYRQDQPQWQMRKTAQTDDHGSFRVHDLSAGRYYLRAVPRGSNADGPSPYAPVIYPNATRMADALAVRIAPGGEVQGINIILHQTVTYSVSGRIVDLRAAKPVANAILTVRLEEMPQSAPTVSQSRADGSFRLLGLSPGRYRMMIGDSGEAIRTMAPPNVRTFDVRNGDVTDLTICLGPGTTLKGRLKVEGGDLPAHARIILVSQNGALPRSSGGTVDGDGRFEVSDVQPGAYDFQLISPVSSTNEGPRFYVREIAMGGQDATEKGIVVPEVGGEFEVTATIDYHGGKISGSVTDSDDQPLKGISVVLVGTDPKRRESARYFRRSTSDSTGAFHMRAIIPGDYVLVLWPGDDPGQLQDPEVLAQVEKYAERVHLQGDGSVTQNLKLAKELRTIAQTFAQ